MSIEQVSILNLTYRAEFQSFALRMTHDVDRARDLLQEVNFQVVKNRNSFQPGTNFSAWVKRIIHNVFISEYRRTKRRAKILDQNRVSDGWLNNRTTDNQGVRALEEEDVSALINQLPDVYRNTFSMYFQGLSYQDIATRSKVPVGTIKSRLHKARKLLKEQLGDYGYVGSGYANQAS